MATFLCEQRGKGCLCSFSNGQPKVEPATSFGVIRRRQEVGGEGSKVAGIAGLLREARGEGGRIALQSWPTAFAVLVGWGQAEGRNRVVEQLGVCRWARGAGWAQSCTQRVRWRAWMNLGLLSLSARQREKQIRAWEMGREAAAGRCSEDQASGGQQGERSPDWERFRLGMGSGQSLMDGSVSKPESHLALCRSVWRCPLGLVPGHQWRAFCAGRRLGKSSGGGCSGLQWGAVEQFWSPWTPGSVARTAHDFLGSAMSRLG